MLHHLPRPKPAADPVDCAWRCDSGPAHIDSLIEEAVSQQARRGVKVWWECQTCEQTFTGATLTGPREGVVVAGV